MDGRRFEWECQINSPIWWVAPNQFVFLLIFGWMMIAGAMASTVGAKESSPVQSNLYDPFVAAQRKDAELHSLFPLSSDRLWAVGDRGLILASDDGGIRWTEQESGTTCSLRDIYFADPLRGWAVGYAVQPFSRRLCGVLLATHDGGKKWNYIAQPLLPPLHGIRRTESGNLIAWGGWSTQLGSSVFESLDGGQNWSPSPHITHEFTSIYPMSIGWIGMQTDGAAIQWSLHATQTISPEGNWQLFSTDGQTVLAIDQTRDWFSGSLANPKAWRKVSGPSALTNVTVLEQRANICIAAGEPSHLMARSLDGGVTWLTTENPLSASLKRFAFLDSNRGWALSEMGHILATRDGGQSWWIQRPGFNRLGVMFIVSEGEKIPWNSIAFCTTELQRSTSLIVATQARACSYEQASQRRRIQAAASSIGVNHVKFMAMGEGGNATKVERPQHIDSIIRQYVPEMIVVAQDDSTARSSLKETVLRIVMNHVQEMRQRNTNATLFATHPKIHKVFTTSNPKLRSVEISDSQVLKRSGKLLGEVSQRAVTLYETQVDLDHADSLLLVYADEPGEGSATTIGSGYLASPDAARPIALEHQGNLQVVLGSTARRKSLQRLIDSSQRESLEESWDDYFKQVVASLTRDELEFSLVWLANRLKEQGKWLHWQVVAETLIRRQPDSGAAELMWVELLAVAASAELNHWRTREIHDGSSPQPSTGVVTASAQTSDSPPTSPFGAFATDSQPAERNLEDNSPTPVEQGLKESDPKSPQPMNSALMQWLTEQLPIRHPMLTSQPEILLQLSSWYRRNSTESPLVVEVQNGLRNISVQSYPSAWQTAAQFESSLWLQASRAKTSAGPGGVHDILKQNIGRNTVSIYTSADRPLLDGLPNDACWSNAAEIRLSEVSLGSPSTTVRLAFDEEWLFVWIGCQRDPQTKRTSPATKRQYDSDLSEEDRIRLILDVDRDRMTTFHFEVDQRGLTRDNCWGLTQWNPRWHVAQHHTETQWMSEFAIPFSELTSSPRIAGSHWCLGIERTTGSRPLGRWPLGSSPKVHPIDLGILHFTTAPAFQLPAVR